MGGSGRWAVSGLPCVASAKQGRKLPGTTEILLAVRRDPVAARPSEAGSVDGELQMADGRWQVENGRLAEPPLCEASTAAFVLLLSCGLLCVGCPQRPGGYDYHGGPAELPRLDTVGTWDLPELSGIPDGRPAEESGRGPDVGGEVGQSEAGSEIVAPDAVVLTGKVRNCRVALEFEPPDGGAPAVAGEFTDWVDGELPMSDPDGDGTFELEIDLAGMEPGSYGYKFHTSADGWFLDPANPTSKWVSGVENSKLRVPDCRVPELSLAQLSVDAKGGAVAVSVELLDGVGSQGAKVATARAMLNGKALPSAGFDAQKGRFELVLDGLKTGTKASLIFSIENEFGSAEPLYLPVWLDDEPWEWRDAVIYFAFTDRFANGNPDNDGVESCAVKDGPANWHNGDFEGIRQQIEAGYFDELGVNVLWISPVIDNAGGCFSGHIPGVAYTSYHGYFPLDIEATEEHFGTMEELVALVNAAHERGIRVLFDFVANHVHESSPIYQQHKDDGWFHPFYPCDPNWDKPIECWFMPYLPDLDYTNDKVVEMTVQNALFWIRETGADGFRVDAVKHMVHNFIRSLRHRIEQGVHTETSPFYMVGETFMGEWGGGTGMAETVIKEYVNDWELDGQFDFPLYWKLLRSVGRDEGDFEELASMFEVSLGYWGKDALMVSFIGNHDVPRFVSHAAGQIADQWGNGSKEQGVSAPPPQPADADPYLRLQLAMGLVLTLPEIPMFYYGDEVGLAGAGDPDNRRDMLFEGLTSHQSGVLELSRKLGKLRRQLEPLRRGDFVVRTVGKDHLVFSRSSGGKTVLVAANRAATSAVVPVNLPGVAGTSLADQLGDSKVPLVGGKATLELPGRGLAVFVLE
ncbi:MAG: hypothetical protein FJ109_10750 [Deltaproteobacteria bacterium]|nr:hypothetical protein [Deltaproteobacteria bacterium]